MIFLTEFKKRATIRQRLLLWELNDYAKKEKKLERELGYFSDSGICPHPSQHLSLLEAKEKQLEGVRAQIRECLERAVEMGMENVEPISLNLPYYVRG